jgi:hypothetical protein
MHSESILAVNGSAHTLRLPCSHSGVLWKRRKENRRTGKIKEGDGGCRDEAECWRSTRRVHNKGNVGFGAATVRCATQSMLLFTHPRLASFYFSCYFSEILDSTNSRHFLSFSIQQTSIVTLTTSLSFPPPSPSQVISFRGLN